MLYKIFDQAAARFERKYTERASERLSECTKDSVAELSKIYFPALSAPLNTTNMRPVSDIAVHPSRIKDLRIFLNNAAEFSSLEQDILLEYVLAGKGNILGILGTGFGKTTLIMTISKMYSQARVVLVILSLSFLHHDLKRRAKNFGPQISRWSPTGFNENVHIITCAVEYLANKSFHKWVVEQKSFQVR